jgi:hypothetical protein
MNNTLKFGLMAAMMVASVLAVSGSASATSETSIPKAFALNHGFSHECSGIVDSNCTCKVNDGFCHEGDPCSSYAYFTCIVGGGGLFMLNTSLVNNA